MFSCSLASLLAPPLLGTAAICNFMGGERVRGLVFTGLAVYTAMPAVQCVQQLVERMIFGNPSTDECARFVKETFYIRDICLSDGKTTAAKLTGRCLPDGTEEFVVCLPRIDVGPCFHYSGRTNLTEYDENKRHAFYAYLKGRVDPLRSCR
jgi:hypothetical protein